MKKEITTPDKLMFEDAIKLAEELSLDGLGK